MAKHLAGSTVLKSEKHLAGMLGDSVVEKKATKSVQK